LLRGVHSPERVRQQQGKIFQGDDGHASDCLDGNGAIGAQEPVVADLHKAGGQDMLVCRLFLSWNLFNINYY